MNDLDRIASRLADTFYRQTEHRKQKWQDTPPAERSFWRLMARVALKEAQGVNAQAPERPSGLAARLQLIRKPKE